jgi:predicted nucleic acid-binding protein
VLAVVNGVGPGKNFMNEGNFFVDTNVLVYAFDTSTPDKRRIAQQLLQLEGNHGRLILSTQVLQEFFVTVTRKLPQPLSLEIAYEAVRNLAEYPLVQIDKNLIPGNNDWILIRICRHSSCSKLFTLRHK